jgi:hypothetical protein
MTSILQRLVADAVFDAGGSQCSKGFHRWESNGGRPCPKDLPAPCSQPVYECVNCGATDYGYRGGPGHHFCETECRFAYLAEDDDSVDSEAKK